MYEITNILNKDIYPTRFSDKPDQNKNDSGDKKESALGSIGLKPKLT